jgi:hypothetical protein
MNWNLTNPQIPAQGEWAWSLWVQNPNDPQNPNKPAWRRLGSNVFTLTAPPTGVHYDTYNSDLINLLQTLALAKGSAWNPQANSNNFYALWKNPDLVISDASLPTITDDSVAPNGAVPAPIVSTDALMLFLSRKGTAHPPFSYGARLAWHIIVNKDKLSDAIANMAVTYKWTSRTGLRYAMFPITHETDTATPALLSKSMQVGYSRVMGLTRNLGK